MLKPLDAQDYMEMMVFAPMTQQQEQLIVELYFAQMHLLVQILMRHVLFLKLDAKLQDKVVLLVDRHARLTREQQHLVLVILELMEIVKEQAPLLLLVLLNNAQMHPQHQIQIQHAQPFKLGVLQQDLDALHHWEHAHLIKEQHRLAPNIKEMMETALPLLHKLLLLHVVLKFVLMLEANPLTLDVNPFHTNVSPMVRYAYCLEVVKPSERLYLVKELVHVILDRNVWIDQLVWVIPHNHYAY